MTYISTVDSSMIILIFNIAAEAHFAEEDNELALQPGAPKLDESSPVAVDKVVMAFDDNDDIAAQPAEKVSDASKAKYQQRPRKKR